MSHKDQQQLLARRHTQPRNQVWSTANKCRNAELDDGSCELSSFGPLNNVIETAPATQKVVPNIFAALLNVFAFTCSNLFNLFKSSLSI